MSDAHATGRDGAMAPERRAVGIRATYDAVARAYDAQMRDELEGKPLDRALLEAFVELVGTGTIADVGCGTGHITRFLAERHPDVVGVDLSPGMIAIARERAPHLSFAVGSMLELEAPESRWAGAIAMYSIIHLSAGERAVAFGELARVVRPGGSVLVAFHVDSPDFATGETNALREWFGQPVELDGHFLDPETVAAELAHAGFAPVARLDREPIAQVEYPSRRSYLLGRRRDDARGPTSPRPRPRRRS